MNSAHSSKTLVRVPGWMVSELSTEGLIEPIVSESRALEPQDYIQMAIVAKDVASTLVAVSAGVKGITAILKLIKKRRDDEDTVEVVVFTNGGRRTWSTSDGALSDETIEEINNALRQGQPDANEEPSPE